MKGLRNKGGGDKIAERKKEMKMKERKRYRGRGRKGVRAVESS